MTVEKKTFKVGNHDLGRDYNDFGWIVSGIETVVTEGVNHFDDDEWDMEVTFTKKVKPIEVGNLVTDGHYTMRIIALAEDYAWCHIYLTPSGLPVDFYSTEAVENLTHAS